MLKSIEFQILIKFKENKLFLKKIIIFMKKLVMMNQYVLMMKSYLKFLIIGDGAD